MLAPRIAAEGAQAFMDKVCELADANGIPSKGYKSILSEFSVDEFRAHLNKVHNSLSSFQCLDLRNNNCTYSYIFLESMMSWALALIPNTKAFKKIDCPTSCPILIW